MFSWVRPAALTVSLAFGAGTLQAEPRPEVKALLDAMSFRDLVAVMRAEGIEYGDLLEEELFPGRGGAAWNALVEQTYDTGAMYDAFATRFSAELDAIDTSPMTRFFSSDRGERIVDFEISARRALLDEGIEDAAIEAFRDLEGTGDDRLALVQEFIAVNDLVESNVMGAMNSNLAFYKGLLDGNAFPRQLSEQQVLSDVWSQEPEIREDTIEWVNSYLLMAYQPLSRDDMETYIAMARTEEGQALNRALFAAFDEVFTDIAHRLGFAAARFIAGQDI